MLRFTHEYREGKVKIKLTFPLIKESKIEIARKFASEENLKKVKNYVWTCENPICGDDDIFPFKPCKVCIPCKASEGCNFKEGDIC